MLLLFAVLLSACGGVTQDDSNQSSEPEILEDIDDASVPYSVTRASFEAELTCNGQTVVPDSVFEVENLVENKINLSFEEHRNIDEPVNTNNVVSKFIPFNDINSVSGGSQNL